MAGSIEQFSAFSCQHHSHLMVSLSVVRVLVELVRGMGQSILLKKFFLSLRYASNQFICICIKVSPEYW